jgi:hypothetical protein
MATAMATATATAKAMLMAMVDVDEQWCGWTNGVDERVGRPGGQWSDVARP